MGVISDTHGLLRPEAVVALRGARRIVHAGDVGSSDVIEALARIAPVDAVRGNNDRGAWADALPETLTLTIDGVRVHVLHDVHDLGADLRGERIRVVIAGHSHRPRNEVRDGVLHLNPGSAGPRRFSLPIAIARLWLAPEPRAEIVELTLR